MIGLQEPLAATHGATVAVTPAPAVHAYEEAQRLALLAELGVLDTDPEPGFDALTQAAAAITQCPIALISLVDGDRQWFKARLGLDESQTPRKWSFCNHAIRGPELMEVCNATADVRFADNPLVVDGPQIRFYAGQPLDVDGVRIGTLCVIDTKPRVLNVAEREALQVLGAAASAMLAERRKRTVSAEQRRRLTEFAMVAGDWLWESDSEHRIVWMSSAYGNNPPLPEPWVLGQPMANGDVLETPDFPAGAFTTLHRLFNARGGFARALVRCDVQGTSRYLSHSAVCRRDGSGLWTGYRGITRDLTASVSAEIAHRTASKLLADLSAQVPGVIFQMLLDARGRLSFRYVSNRISEILELDAQQVMKSSKALLLRFEREGAVTAMQAIHRSAATMAVWQDTLRVRLPIAGQRVVQVHAEPTPTVDGGVLWHGLVTDITEQLRSAAQVQTLTALDLAAKRTAEIRSDFLSRVSHEFRTPLNAILGFSQLIRLQGARQPLPALLSSVQHIEHAGTHLLSLVNDMLDLASLEAGRSAVHLEPVSLIPLAEQSIALLGPLAQHRGLTLKVACTGPMPTVLGDARAIRQILFNLLGNAIKFAHPNTCIQVHVRCIAGQPDVAMDIIDEGPGIRIEALPLLFTPFNSGRPVGAQPYGTGLGLAISHKLTQAMGGHLDVSSVPGKGTTFTVRLRVDGRQSAKTSGDSAFGDLASSADAQVDRGATVLYIEDDEVNALLMQAVFQSVSLAHVRLVVAVNGREGIKLAHAISPGLILLDMQLPDMDGCAVLDELKHEPGTAGIPVVVLSGDAMPEQVAKARAAGCQDYWTKPINLQSIVSDLSLRFPATLDQKSLGSDGTHGASALPDGAA
ncbi:MAG: ATP-binding protein [Caldimonas sp.]